MPYLIDMHLHLQVGSPDSILTVEQLIRQAKALGIHAGVITEHDTMEGSPGVEEEARSLGFLLLRGVEVKAKEGDFLVYGVAQTPPFFWRALELIDWVHQQGGIIGPAHPFRSWNNSVARKVSKEMLALIWNAVDFIETANGCNDVEDNIKAEIIAKKYQKPGIGGSDAHEQAMVGRAVTVFDIEVRSIHELVDALRTDKVSGTRIIEAQKVV